jgi:hypothetical protein
MLRNQWLPTAGSTAAEMLKASHHDSFNASFPSTTRSPTYFMFRATTFLLPIIASCEGPAMQTWSAIAHLLVA